MKQYDILFDILEFSMDHTSQILGEIYLTKVKKKLLVW